MRCKDLVYDLEQISTRHMDVGDYEKWLEDDGSAEDVVSLIIELGSDFSEFNEYLED